MTHPRRSAVALLAALALVLALAACGGDDDSAEVTDDAPIATSDEASTTVAAPPDEETATTDDASTTEDDGDEPIAGSDDEVEADEEADGDGWALSPGTYRGQDGLRVAYECSPGGDLRTVWGTDTYTDDSSVCTAAVHAGLITQDEGGRVVIEIAPGEESYEGTEANGVETNDYGSWDGSYTFPTA